MVPSGSDEGTTDTSGRLRESQGNGRFERCLHFTCVVSGRPDERVGGGVHRLELHGLRDGVIGAHPEHLLSPHQDAVGVFGGVEKDLDVADAALLPLADLTVPAEELCALLEQDLLVLLTGLGLHLRDGGTRG